MTSRGTMERIGKASMFEVDREKIKKEIAGMLAEVTE